MAAGRRRGNENGGEAAGAAVTVAYKGQASIGSVVGQVKPTAVLDLWAVSPAGAATSAHGPARRGPLAPDASAGPTGATGGGPPP